MSTFSDLGLHFRLFEAPVTDACVDKAGACEYCGCEVSMRFEAHCYQCFRAGHAKHTMDTMYGMVRPVDAARGLTHGLPMDPERLPDGLALVPHDVDPEFPNDHWFHVRCNIDDLVELTRTPGYHTWQGECWMFCCGRPCVFLGSQSADQLNDLAAKRSTSGQALIADITSSPTADGASWLEGLQEEQLSLYVFRCLECDRLVGHWDTD